MKEQILALTAQGKTYKEIALEVNCSKSVVSYHCNPLVKEKSHNRIKLNKRKQTAPNRLYIKVDSFKGRHKRNSYTPEGNVTTKEIIDKYGHNTVCYLTGKPIDLALDDYQLDHIIPISKGGSCNIDNLGITCPEANYAKGSLSISEFIILCTEVLTNFGFTITNNINL